MSKLDKYLRLDMMPHFTCTGCTHGIAWASMVRAIDQLGLNQNETIMVCAIGCAGRLPIYLDFPSIRTPHGRALSYATGIKLANPKLNIVVFMGDGDAVAIGGNHFIHTARRNINLTAIVAINEIYGMTGGQYAPTTSKGVVASTSPFGMIEPATNVCKLAIGAGSTFVGRGDVYHVRELTPLIKKAILHKGFSVVEILTNCSTHTDRRKKKVKYSEAVKQFKDLTVNATQAQKMTSDDLEGKLIRGVLHQENLPEYVEEYDRITGFKEEGVC